MSNLHSNFKLNHRTWGKWFNHGPAYHKEIQLLSLVILSMAYKYDLKVHGNYSNPFFIQKESPWAETSHGGGQL